jgi:hypothetical protein
VRAVRAAHGRVRLSSATPELVPEGLPPAAGLRDLGAQPLKALQRPERLFQGRGIGSGPDFPALRTLESSPNNLPASKVGYFSSASLEAFEGELQACALGRALLSSITTAFHGPPPFEVVVVTRSTCRSCGGSRPRAASSLLPLGRDRLGVPLVEGRLRPRDVRDQDVGRQGAPFLRLGSASIVQSSGERRQMLRHARSDVGPSARLGRPSPATMHRSNLLWTAMD